MNLFRLFQIPNRILVPVNRTIFPFSLYYSIGEVQKLIKLKPSCVTRFPSKSKP